MPGWHICTQSNSAMAYGPKQMYLWLHHWDANVSTKSSRFPPAHCLDLDICKHLGSSCRRPPNSKRVTFVHFGVIYPMCKAGCQLIYEIWSRYWSFIGEAWVRCETTNTEVAFDNWDRTMLWLGIYFKDNGPIIWLVLIMTYSKLHGSFVLSWHRLQIIQLYKILYKYTWKHSNFTDSQETMKCFHKRSCYAALKKPAGKNNLCSSYQLSERGEINWTPWVHWTSSFLNPDQKLFNIEVVC